MNKYGKVYLGVNDKGLHVYVSGELIAQKGLREVREALGFVRRYPVSKHEGGRK
jgi:hypothetical protein